MNRVDTERDYWNVAALDSEVDEKYICEAEYFDDCLEYVTRNIKGKSLEIGCGVGRLAIPLSEKYDVTGIDISQNMLDIAKKRSKKPTFKLNNGLTIPFKDSTFDSVYCVAVLQHLKEAGVIMYIQEASRVLKPKGTFVFQFIQGLESEPFSNHYQLEHIESILSANGFSIKEVKEGVGHHMWTWIVACK